MKSQGCWVLLAMSLFACSGRGNQPGQACPTLSGSPWIPQIKGALGSSRSPKSTLTREVFNASGTTIGYLQGAGVGQEVSITFPMNEPLGPYGSLSLIAETKDSRAPKGRISPMLVSLSDGKNEWIQFSRRGACQRTGIFVQKAGLVDLNSDCVFDEKGAYADLSQWQVHQVLVHGLSINTFPTCNWDSGPSTCAFSSRFFDESHQLRSGTGVQYTARFILMDMVDETAVAGQSAELKLTVIKKRDFSTDPGALDLNIVMVGSKNIEASRTPKGQQNLNLLVEKVSQIYSQRGVSIRIGKVSGVEWPCEQNGDAYANIEEAALETMLAGSSQLLPAESDGHAINLFLVSTINHPETNSQSLGLSGALGGPPLNGSVASGITFASFDMLADFNPLCSLDSCPESLQEEAFIDMGGTMGHEIGHYLGLNHPSERAGTQHDTLPDTPKCSKGEISSTTLTQTITRASCAKDPYRLPDSGRTCAEACRDYDGKKNFCPAQPECQFNHLMWWTAKGFDPLRSTGDGNLMSPASVELIRYHPLIQ